MAKLSKKEAEDDKEERRRVPLDQRFRNRMHNMVYGNTPDTNAAKVEDKPPSNPDQ